MIRSIAALVTVGLDAVSSWFRRACRQDDVFDGWWDMVEGVEVGVGLGPTLLLGFLEQCEER